MKILIAILGWKGGAGHFIFILLFFLVYAL